MVNILAAVVVWYTLQHPQVMSLLVVGALCPTQQRTWGDSQTPNPIRTKHRMGLVAMNCAVRYTSGQLILEVHLLLRGGAPTVPNVQAKNSATFEGTLGHGSSSSTLVAA